MPEAPTLSAEQRRAAAAKSVELRRQRADLKAWLRDPGVLDAPCYDNPVNRFKFAWQHPAGRGMKLYDLLVSLPAVGPAKATALLEKAGIPLKNTVRACGPRQTERLFALLQK